MKRKLIRWVAAAGMALTGVFGVLIPTGMTLHYLPILSNREQLLSVRTRGAVIYDREGNLIASAGEQPPVQHVAAADIPESFKQAVVATEDKQFYRHHGFSLRSILRALSANVRSGSLSQGGSTIPQQVIKNTILSADRSIWRKYQELILAVVLDQLYDKQTILSLYANTIYFGNGAYGLEEAAQRYFGKPARDLTAAESSYLTGLIAAPSRYADDRGAAKERQRVVLAQMREEGFLNQQQVNELADAALPFANARKDLLGTAPHFSLYLYDRVREQLGLPEGELPPLRITSTLDSTMQRHAEDIVTKHLSSLRRRGANNAAVVVLDAKTGEIRAMVGSHDWENETNGKINMAVTPRQIGSSFKPIVYAAAFEQRRITPVTLLPDLPKTYQTVQGPWKPLDYDRQFRGPVLPRRALANSLNLPAVAVMERVGIENAVEYARSFGLNALQTPDRYGLSFVLGTAEVSLLDMTRAYAVFANNGELPDVSAYTVVLDTQGRKVREYAPARRRVISESTAFLINSYLSDARARREEFGALLDTRTGAAVKTGTTEHYRDSLTIGYTPEVVVGVWVGNNDNRPMDRVAGSLGAAPIWRDLIEAFTAGRPAEFDRPEAVRQKTVCQSSVLLPFEATPSAVREFILPGTPDASCSGQLVDRLTRQP